MSTLKPVDTAAALASGSTTRPPLSQPRARALPLLLGSGPCPFEAARQSSKGRPEAADLRPNPLTGNCRFLGCMLSHKLDYDPSATAAARCAVEGCTDARYPNYRANAVYDDGSCKVRVRG